MKPWTPQTKSEAITPTLFPPPVQSESESFESQPWFDTQSWMPCQLIQYQAKSATDRNVRTWRRDIQRPIKKVTHIWGKTVLKRYRLDKIGESKVPELQRTSYCVEWVRPQEPFSILSHIIYFYRVSERGSRSQQYDLIIQWKETGENR